MGQLRRCHRCGVKSSVNPKWGEPWRVICGDTATTRRRSSRLRADPGSGALTTSPRPAEATSAGWRQPLREALAALPPDRQRRLRSFSASAEPAQLQPSPHPPLLDLASNDYLGFSRHPAVRAAAAAELQRSGLGAGASRLISGTRPVHEQLEEALADWLGRERALLFPSGFQANLAAVAALADRHSLVLADRLIHHSLLAGVKACGARLRESLFSMEGTSPDLPALQAICAAHGAALLLDEAHALGVLGPGGRGLGQRGDTAPALISGTFGKAFGSGGAFLAGDALVIEWLLQHSGAFRYTTALAPPLAAGALAALQLLQEQERHGQAPGVALLERAGRWRDALQAAGWPRPAGQGPILPLLVGGDGQALALQQRLEQAGLLSVAIRPPTVPEGTARLRLVLRHDLPAGSLARLLEALGTP